jgi:predicted flap endonuclease-1-like 5' DNA nuclease
MLYLAAQFLWFLVAAFGLGLAMGWISHGGGKAQLWSRSLGYAAAAWALGAALTWMQALNGVAALWVESALLFVAVYFAGCALAAVVRAALRPARTAPAGLSPVEQPPAAVPTPASSESSEKPLVDDGKTVIVDMKAVRDRGKQPAKVEEAELPGERPAGLVAARDEQADDLKLIKGIGRQNEARLHGLGIWHFDQIAAWTAENVEWTGGYLAFPGRIEREDWVGQAKALAGDAETAFAKRASAGEVASLRDDGSYGQANVATLSDGGFEGERPKNLLDAARDGKPDDLELIRGIGPAIAADLNRLGLWHFDQIAALRDAEIRYACAFSGVPARGTSDNWREDADILANGGETAHSRALKAARKPAET